MNVKTLIGALLAAMLGWSLGMPVTALAGERHHERNDYGHGGGHEYRHHKRHFKHHRKWRHDNYNYGHRRHTTNYYRYDNDNDDLLIGLVVGGILGYAINGAQHQNDISYNRGYDNSYDRYPRTRNTYPVTDTYSYNDSSCLQEREYQTTVIVGGRNVEAYGTACLQPDGSWKRGPAQTVTY